MNYSKTLTIKSDMPSKVENKELKVFLVEDDIYFNKVVERYLLKIGFKNQYDMEIVCFYNGQDCINELGQNPDLVILDFYLDSNNDITCTGYDVLQKIKAENIDTMVVIMSQQHEWANFRKEFIEFGALDFLRKDDELYDNLQNLITDNLELR